MAVSFRSISGRAFDQHHGANARERQQLRRMAEQHRRREAERTARALAEAAKPAATLKEKTNAQS